MKKLLFITFLVLAAVSVNAQTVYKSEVLKSFRSGTMKLYQTEKRQYSLIFKTNNRYQPTFACILGDRERALRLLHFLEDLKLGKDDIADLENESHNYVMRGLWGTLRILSDGHQFYYDVTHKDVRQMIEIIEGGSVQQTEEAEQDDD